MRFLLFFTLVITSLFSNERDIIENNKEKLEKIYKTKLSLKEKKYLEYKEQLEKENRKLEEDGFCSCNNN